jgi:hypothetical protein
VLRIGHSSRASRLQQTIECQNWVLVLVLRSDC